MNEDEMEIFRLLAKTTKNRISRKMPRNDVYFIMLGIMQDFFKQINNPPEMELLIKEILSE